MPLYDYQCESCGKEFTAAVSITEHDRREVMCPGCGSNKLKQRAPFCLVEAGT